MTKRPRLSKEDQELWSRVAKSVRPLKKETKAAEPSESGPESGKAPPKVKKKAAPRPRQDPLVPLAMPKREPKPLDPSRLHDIDGRNAERLRRGQMPIEAVLDLHGHRQHEAHESLNRFLASAQAADKRCILVITGKGRIGEESGVLRKRLGDWLNESGNRGRVLAFAQAQPKHGGAGAFYVLLKRRRANPER
ncbi:Smr/MutS family protein [Limibacillus halophilus]|jgi:DNA-nicking Smr family endonuclease